MIAAAGTNQTERHPREPDMNMNITTQALQYLLAGGAALAITFPTPQDAKIAFTKAFFDEPPVAVEMSGPDAVIVPASLEAEPRLVSFDPAAECLLESDKVAKDRLEYCAEILWETIAVYETPHFTEQGDFVAPNRDPLNPQSEEMRRTLVTLCRSIWIADGGSLADIQTPGCAFAISGVEDRS